MALCIENSILSHTKNEKFKISIYELGYYWKRKKWMLLHKEKFVLTLLDSLLYSLIAEYLKNNSSLKCII